MKQILNKFLSSLI